MRLRALLHALDRRPGGARGLEQQAETWLSFCEGASSYAQLSHGWAELQRARGELAEAGLCDPARDRRVSAIVDRLHACAPAGDLPALVAGEDWSTAPVRSPASGRR